jgi:TolB-like protein
MSRVLSLLFGSMLLAGCSHQLTSAYRISEPLAKGARVAVLPFENLSGKEGASEKITEYMVLALQRGKNIEVTEFGQVYEQMRRYRIRSATLLTDAQLDSLASGLKIGYVVTGSVLDYHETDNLYLGKIPQVSINVRLIDCTTHQTIWTGVANARGDQSETVFGLGAVRSLEELAHSVVSKASDNISAVFRK